MSRQVGGMVSYSVEDNETIAENEEAFVSDCRELGTRFNSGAKLLREIATLSPSHGLIWRADYEDWEISPTEGEPVIVRFVCWRLRDAKPGEEFMLQAAVHGSLPGDPLLPLPDNQK